MLKTSLFSRIYFRGHPFVIMRPRFSGAMSFLLVIAVLSAVLVSECLASNVFKERLNYKIVLPKRPSDTQKFAAAELAGFLSRIYDENINLNGSDSELFFFVGLSSSAKSFGFTNVPDVHTDFGVFRNGRSFLFLGYDDKGVVPAETIKGYAGTLSAVYYFLNRHAGADFLFPGEKGTFLVKNKKIFFSSSKEAPVPSFQLRGFSMRTKVYSKADMTLFFRRMLGNIPYWCSYDFYYIYMYKWKKRFWKTHPEYFMLRDGNRVSARYPYHIPCLSNPDVLRRTADDLLKKLKEDPNIKTIRLFCDAPVRQCQCRRCVESKERSLAKNDSASGEEFYGFQKRVADIVWKTRPDIQFYTQTKGKSYYRPPTMIELGPRFTVAQLVPRVNPKSDFDFYVKLAGEWKGNSVKTILKSYPRYDVNTYMDYPIMTPYYTVDYLRKFADVVEGADNSELYFKIPYSFSALGQYVQMKALFDISAPAGKWVERFCSLVYPGASGTMVEFYKSMDDLYRMRSSSLGDPLLDAYYPDNLNKPMALLDAAAKKIDKSHSRWFDDLYCDFKKFHAYCQSQKKRVDALRKAVDKKFEVPFTEKNCSLDIPPDSWKGALEESFMTPENYVDFQKSKVLFACSKRFLFIGLVACEKSPGRLKSECGTMGEGAIWSDDCFEIMLMPEPDSVSYYQIVCNSRGVFRVLKCGRKSKEMKDLKLCVRAMVGKTKWSVALAVPLDQFPKRAFSGTWRFDAFRSRYLKERKSEDHQISGISLLSRSYHNVNEYVKLTWPELLRR